MTCVPTPVPLAVPGPRRPEVPALAAAIANPLEGFNTEGSVGRVIMLDLGLAQDLLMLVADLCGEGHVACCACGEQYVCTVCQIGDPSSWCWCPSGFGNPLCPTCKAENCRHCETGGH